MLNLFKNFCFTLSTFSRIPCPNVEYSEETTKYTFFCLSLVGLVLGIIYYVTALIAINYLNNPAIIAIILIIVNIFVTGGIHFDGYLDSSDAFKSYRSYEEKKRIIKDSNIGAFALINLVLILGLYFVAYYYVIDTNLTILLLIAPIISRTFTMMLICYNDQEDNDLLQALMSNLIKKYHLLFFIVYLGLAFILIYFNFSGNIISLASLIIIVAIAYTLFFNKTFKRHFKAMSGDLCGYFIIVMEMIIPLTIVILYPIIGLLT